MIGDHWLFFILHSPFAEKEPTATDILNVGYHSTIMGKIHVCCRRAECPIFALFTLDNFDAVTLKL